MSGAPDGEREIHMKLVCWIVLVFAAGVLLVQALERGASLVNRLTTPMIRWAKYRLNAAAVSTLLLTAAVLAAWALGGIGYYRTKEPDMANAYFYGIKTIFQIMEGDSEEFRAAFPNYPILVGVLCTSIPVLTVTTVISFLIGFIPWPIPDRTEYFIFSQIDERGILLAEDLFRLHENEIGLIFLRASKDELKIDTANRLKKIHARVYPYVESELLEIHFGLKRKKLRFFFLSSDTDVNFKCMDTLIEEAGEKGLFQTPKRLKDEQIRREEEESVYRQELYLLSETDSASMLIDHLRLKLCETEAGTRRKNAFIHTDLRLLDRYRTVTYHLLREKPLYEAADDRTVRVLVLGFGRVGQAFFRAAASFCAMDGYKTTFCLCDQEIEKQWETLALQYPECDRGLCVTRKNIDVESRDLIRFLNRKNREKVPFTYIVLSLGDDERNIRVASKLKRHYRRLYWKDVHGFQPVICVNLEDPIKSEYVPCFFQNGERNASDGEKVLSVPLHVFGSDHDTFSEKMLMDRGVWTAARKLRAILKCRSFVYWREYERRSSVACALHAPYHIHALLGDQNETEYETVYGQLSEAQKERMIDAEHIRWMRYTRCEGFQTVSREMAQRFQEVTGNHMDPVAKLSPCLIETKKLDELYETLYPAGAGHTSVDDLPFKQRDERVVRNAWRLCQIMDGKSEQMLQ